MQEKFIHMITAELIDEEFDWGCNYRVLAGGYPHLPAFTPRGSYVPRPRNATLATYIVANESRMALTGHPVDPNGQIVSLLTGSRNKEGDNIFAQYTTDGTLEILTREQVIKNGYPVLEQYVRIDQYQDWPKENDVYTPPSPIAA